ncbi:hypothetical protein GCM10020331_018640 [Ectobacillus funiculus]
MSKYSFQRKKYNKKLKELGAIITEDYKGTLPLAVGVLKGAMPFMADLLKTCRDIS